MRTYFIRAGETEMVKIGRSVNPTARLIQLQIGHTELLTLIRVIESDVEDVCHRRFATQRVRGEWFRFSPEMLTFSIEEEGELYPPNLPGPPDIERAARDAGLSVAALCRRADMGAEIFYRWKKQEHSITTRNLQKLLDALEREKANGGQ